MSVEVIELQDSARRVLSGAGLAAAEDATWEQIIALGWLLVAVPESLSGLEAGVQGACALHTELGRRLATAPYLPSMLAAEAMCQSGMVDREQWLERMMGGELFTAALAECNIRTDGKTLNGVATGVQSADNASHCLLWTADHDAVCLVALGQPAVEQYYRPTWDQTRRLFDVRLNDVTVAEQVLLAEGAEARVLIQRLLAMRDFALAADAIGGANALLEMTVEHLQTRIQFKRPLAMFQALKHRCADMKAFIAGAEAMLADALSRWGDQLDSQDARLKAKGAKMLATSVFAAVAEDCLQLHGGIGMADEHPCHLFLKRALLSEQLTGATNDYAAEIAAALIAGTN